MASAKDIIRHSFCEHPHCHICRSNEALLCNELVGPDGTRYLTTKRERDIAKIIKDFFYTKYKLQIMDKENFPLSQRDLVHGFCLILHINYTQETLEIGHTTFILSQEHMKEKLLLLNLAS